MLALCSASCVKPQSQRHMCDTTVSQVVYRSVTQVHLCTRGELVNAKEPALQQFVCRVRGLLEVLSLLGIRDSCALRACNVSGPG